MPGAEHMLTDYLAHVRRRWWDFLVRELMGIQPPAYGPTSTLVDPELLAKLFA